MSKKSKKRDSRNKKSEKKFSRSEFDTMSLNELLTIPTNQIVQMLIEADDGLRADFAYPYKVLCEAYDLVEKYDNLRSFMLAQLMNQLGFVNTTGGTIKFTKDVTNIIKDTAKTPAYKEMEGYPAKARELLGRLYKATALMEKAFENHPEMEDYKKSMMRNCMAEASQLLIGRFELVSKEEGALDEW